MAHVKIPSADPTAAYIAAAGQVAFPVPFPFFTSNDVQVYANGVLAATGYSVSGVVQDGGFQSGTVTFATGRAAGDRIFLRRDVPVERLTDFPYPSRTLDIQSVNTEFDRVFAILSDRASATQRALMAPAAEEGIEPLPLAAARANRVLAFDELGRPTTVLPETWGGTFEQEGTGAFPRPNLIKMRERLSVADFGAFGNGDNDDTNAVQRAVNAAAETKKMEVHLGGLRPRVSDHIVVPDGVNIIGPHRRAKWWGSLATGPATLNSMPGTILLEPGAMLRPGYGSGFYGMTILPYGRSFPLANRDAFAPLHAISADGYKDDVTVYGCAIMGFNVGLFLVGSRQRVEHNAIDCDTCVEALQSFDTSRFLHNQFWNWATASTSPTWANTWRAGSALYLHDGADGTVVDDNLELGHQYGVRLFNANGWSINSMWTDGLLPPPEATGSIGILLEAGAGAGRVTNSQTWTKHVGFRSDAGPSKKNVFHNVSAQNCFSDGIQVSSGDLDLSGEAVNCGGAGLAILTDSSDVNIRALDTRNCVTGPVFFQTQSNRVTGLHNVTSTSGAGSAIVTGAGLVLPAIAAASILPLPTSGDAFRVTAGAGVGAISGGWAGRRVTLILDAAATLFDSTNLRLAGDFAGAPGSVITLVYNGAAWFEQSRSVN